LRVAAEVKVMPTWWVVQAMEELTLMERAT
jgi:hypothetical protein